MPRKYPETEFRKKIYLIKKAGLSDKKKINVKSDDSVKSGGVESLEKRILQIFQINKKSRNKLLMTFFVMYDIENDKVRQAVAKYLQKKGCIRIQKSVFFAEQKHEVFKDIFDTLKEVNEIYQNSDSILLIPISADEVRSIKIIGKNVDFEIITGNTNTLFF